MAAKSDGTSKNITWSNTTAVTGITTKTWMFWIYQTSNTTYTIPLSLSNSGGGANENTQLTINHNANGAIEWFCSFTTTGGSWENRTNILTINAWHHIAITYDGSSAANNPILYLDNVVTSIPVQTAPVGTYRTNGSNQLKVLGSTGIASSIVGNILDVRMYNRILTAAEISDIYKSRLAISNLYGLVFHAPLTGASGLQAFDGATVGTGNLFIDRINGFTGAPSGNITGAGNINLVETF